MTTTSAADAAADPVDATGIPLLRFGGIGALPGVRHAVTTRAGGASGGPFASLNLGLHVGDDPEAVMANRARLAAALGLGLGDLVFAAQPHGGAVAVVGRADRGRGARDPATAVAGVDALVTADPGVGLVALVADCVPILLADPVRGTIGVVHAGWRGLAAGAPGNAVAAMAGLGCDPGRLRAAIGPCIGPADYAVGDEVAAALRTRFGGAADAWIARSRDGRPALDLAAAARDQLVAAGLAPDHVEASGISTSRDERLYSHRASGGRTGRFAAAIARIAAGA